MNANRAHSRIDRFLENLARERGLRVSETSVFGCMEDLAVQWAATDEGDYLLRIAVFGDPSALNELVLAELRLHGLELSRKALSDQSDVLEIRTGKSGIATALKALPGLAGVLSPCVIRECRNCCRAGSVAVILDGDPALLCSLCEEIARTQLGLESYLVVDLGLSIEDYQAGMKALSRKARLIALGLRGSMLVLGIFLVSVFTRYPHQNVVTRWPLDAVFVTAFIAGFRALSRLFERNGKYRELVLVRAKRSENTITLKQRARVRMLSSLGLSVLLSASIAYGSALYLNCRFDSSEPERRTVEIVLDGVEAGPFTRYALKDLGNGEEYRMPANRTLGRDLLPLKAGTRLVVYLKAGKLGAAWISRVSRLE